MSSTPDNQLHEAALDDVVAQYHHKLLSLEADLKDRARAGGLSAGSFTRRIRRLARAQRRLAALQTLCQATAPRSLQTLETLGQGDLGLPVLDDCTPGEHAVCERFLIAKEDETQRLEAESARVYRWLQEAVAGRSNPLRLTLRLSALRRMIQSFEKRAEGLQQDEAAVGAQVDKLLEALPARGVDRRDTMRSTLDGLMRLFGQLDQTIGRVARLKAAVKKAETQTQQMSAWLEQQEARLAAARRPMPPPSPLRTAVAAAAARASPLLRQSRARRRLAEIFWTDVLASGGRQPDDKAMARAARGLAPWRSPDAAEAEKTPPDAGAGGPP